jgi:hypothetical protein
MNENTHSVFLLGIVRLDFQLSDRIASILEELHLCEGCAQCVGGGRHRRNCRVTGVLGGQACVFGGVPKRFPLLSDRLELLPITLSDFPDFLGQRADVFSRRAGGFRVGAILFDAATGLLAFFSLALCHFAREFSFDATLLGRGIGHVSLPIERLARSRSGTRDSKSTTFRAYRLPCIVRFQIRGWWAATNRSTCWQS